MKRLYLLTMAVIAVTFLSACGETADPTATLPAAGETSVPAVDPAEEATESPAVPTAEATAATAYPVPDTLAPEASGYPVPEVEAPAAPPQALGYPAPAAAIVVEYTTAPQQEGPYYPLEKRAERDNDLTVVAGAAGPARGEVLEFAGHVYDANGLPVTGAVVEIWQTDAAGIYLHPGDPSTDERDMNFQFYGESVTDAEGCYEFRTIVPGEYEPRPVHIHFKVLLNDEVLLTSQFYPEGGPVPASGQDASLIIILSEGQDAAGNLIYTGQRDIVLSQDLSGR